MYVVILKPDAQSCGATVANHREDQAAGAALSEATTRSFAWRLVWRRGGLRVRPLAEAFQPATQRS